MAAQHVPVGEREVKVQLPAHAAHVDPDEVPLRHGLDARPVKGEAAQLIVPPRAVVGGERGLAAAAHGVEVEREEKAARGGLGIAAEVEDARQLGEHRCARAA